MKIIYYFQRFIQKRKTMLQLMFIHTLNNEKKLVEILIESIANELLIELNSIDKNDFKKLFSRTKYQFIR